MWRSHRNLDRSGTVGAKAELGWIPKSEKGKWKQEDWMYAFLLRSFAKKEGNAMGLGNRWGVKWSFPFERWELHYKCVLMKKIKRKERTDVPGQGGLGLGLGSTESSWSFVWVNLRGSQSAWLASQVQLLGRTELAEKFNQAEVFLGDYNGERKGARTWLWWWL